MLLFYFARFVETFIPLFYINLSRKLRILVDVITNYLLAYYVHEPR